MVSRRVILEQHAEEASFLWLQRRRAVRAPHYTLRQLAGLDARLEAHVDGLRVAGADAWPVLKETLPLEEPGDLFAAISLAVALGQEALLEQAYTVAEGAGALASGAVSALAWAPPDRADREARKLLASRSAARRRLAVASFAVRRVDPGAPLLEAAADGDPMLRARALRALGELGKADHLGLLQGSLGAEDPGVRFWAAWAAALLSAGAEPVALLKSVAEAGAAGAEDAVRLAARRLSPAEARAWRDRLAKKPETARLAVLAAAAAGDPSAVPWLLEQMKVLPLARLAGEAYELITGADLEEVRLTAPPPEGFEAGPTESPEDENVEVDPDGELPWPDAARVGKDWEGRRGRLPEGKRFLLGREPTVASCQEVLRTGRQRQRAAAALELAILQPGAPLFEVRAPGFRQQRALGSPPP
jgi:uncharacterized protein (TIGR02270 family)